ncbi:Putative addiction module component [Aquiflexum balticum DSM 16537]|uniref:Putative addiction module component n=1 Tax=Aquiflexum balticum DSM 16537 TaxID=758820 RepID=A0A1W2H2U2_9BACT|nr:addiction module protein [Aquiflexum balticum]SMD43179.1 Putative addiction module component [Aquiflexum balticum DSM 16537]
MKVVLEIDDDKLGDFFSLIQSIEYANIKEPSEIPSWQKSEILKRISELESGKIKKRSWDSAKVEIFKK